MFIFKILTRLKRILVVSSCCNSGYANIEVDGENCETPT